MNTTKLQAVQGELFGSAKRTPLPLDVSTLQSKPTFLAALKYVIQCGNFAREKELFQELGIDKGNWSRMMSGDASFPQDKEELLQELCGNDGLVIWRAYRKGKGVYDLQEAKDKRIAQLEQDNAQLRAEIETLVKYGVIERPRA